MEKLASAPAIQFKGTGWYVTDYARKSSGVEGGKEAKDKAKDKAGAKESSKESSKELLELVVGVEELDLRHEVLVFRNERQEVGPHGPDRRSPVPARRALRRERYGVA